MTNSNLLITVAVLGGTGKEGKGLAYRWARAGYRVIIGSRTPEKAVAAADEITGMLSEGISVKGLGNLEAAHEANIAVLTVPYVVHRDTLEALKEELKGKILVDVTVPLVPPKVATVQMPAAGSAAQEAKQIVGDDVQVCSAFQNISHEHLLDDADVEGKLEFGAGNLAKAEELLVESRETANLYDLNQAWQEEEALAVVGAARKKHAQAENRFELAISALEGGTERLRPEEFALRFGMDRLHVYDEYASDLAERAIETGEEALAEKAMLVVERRRAQALWDLMALGWAGLPPDAVPEQLQRTREAEARLAAKQAILRDQFSLPPEKRLPEQEDDFEWHRTRLHRGSGG